MGRAPGDILQLLANPTNRTLVTALAAEPQYVRRLAEVVGLTEEEASRRLRALEKLGLVEAEWASLGGPTKRTVRLYRLAKDKLELRLAPEGLTVVAAAGEAPVALRAAESPPRPNLVLGRAREAETLRGLLAQRACVCLHGLGGVGKTTVAAAIARAWPGPVAWHTLAPSESGTLLLARVASDLRALGAPQPTTTPDEEGRLLVDAVARGADGLGALLVLDRFDVAGEGAGDVVASLAGRLARGRVLLVSRVFPRDVPRERVASMPLAGLDRDGTRALLDALSPGASVPSDDVFARTMGHPLAIVLLANAAASRESMPVARLLEQAGIREFLHDDVLPQLPEAERDALVSLSILRRPFTLDEAEAITELPRVRDALLRLAVRGLVSRAGDAFQVHDLLAELLADSAPARAKLHARAARVLLASGEPAKAVEAMSHFLDAGDATRAAEIARVEAQRREQRFLDVGLAEAYAAVLARVASAPSLSLADRAVVELEQSGIDALYGRVAEAKARLGPAARAIPASDRALVARQRIVEAAVAKAEGALEDALRLLREAVDTGREANARILLEALLELAFVMEEKDWRGAFAPYREAIAAAEEVGDVRLLSFAYAGASRWSVRLNRPDAEDLAREALRLALLARSPRAEAMARTTLVELYWTEASQARVGLALEESKTHLALARTLGDPWEVACALTDVSISSAFVGRADEAIEAGAEADAEAQRVGSAYLRVGAAGGMAMGHLLRGEPRATIDTLAPALSAFDAQGLAGPPIFARFLRALEKAHADVGDARGAEAAAKRAQSLEARARSEGWFADA